MPSININSDALVVYAAKLERKFPRALAVAVRQTLNGTVLDVKRDTMIAESDRAFKKRKPSFFQATSRAEFAKGLDINSMSSVVGFVAPSGAKESGHATKDLEEQEHGGDIDKRAFIATDQARTAKGNVKLKFTLAEIKAKIIDSRNANGKNDQERYVKSAIRAGRGGFVIAKSKSGKKMLLAIMSVHRLKKGERESGKAGNTVVNSKAVYSVDAKRKAHVGATHFMEYASAKSAKKMNALFIEMANIQLNKMK